MELNNISYEDIIKLEQERQNNNIKQKSNSK